MTAITSVYIVAPPYLHFSFLDFAIKVWLFISWYSGHQRMDYRFISTLMWFLNVVLPVIMGSYYVLVEIE
jgi:hypothetical protein